mgnify:CR=1 FL=1
MQLDARLGAGFDLTGESIDIAGKPTPALALGGKPINMDFSVVDQFTEATGALTLAVTAPAGYGSWIDDFGLALGDQDPTDDPDSDGFNNLLEYVFGGNPSISSAAIGPLKHKVNRQSAVRMKTPGKTQISRGWRPAVCESRSQQK